MSEHLSKDPLHGITLEQLLTKLVENYGWDGLLIVFRLTVLSVTPALNPA